MLVAELVLTPILGFGFHTHLNPEFVYQSFLLENLGLTQYKVFFELPQTHRKVLPLIGLVSHAQTHGKSYKDIGAHV